MQDKQPSNRAPPLRRQSSREHERGLTKSEQAVPTAPKARHASTPHRNTTPQHSNYKQNIRARIEGGFPSLRRLNHFDIHDSSIHDKLI